MESTTSIIRNSSFSAQLPSHPVGRSATTYVAQTNGPLILPASAQCRIPPPSSEQSTLPTPLPTRIAPPPPYHLSGSRIPSLYYFPITNAVIAHQLHLPCPLPLFITPSALSSKSPSTELRSRSVNSPSTLPWIVASTGRSTRESGSEINTAPVSRIPSVKSPFTGSLSELTTFLGHNHVEQKILT